MKLVCPSCSSADLVRTGRSILDGKYSYHCEACQLALAPARSPIVLWLFFLFSTVMLILGIGFWVFLSNLAKQPVPAAGKPRAIRVGISFYLWPVIAAAAVLLTLREALRPKPVRSSEPEELN